MPMFKYYAKDINSKKVTGKVEAQSRSDLVAFLREKDLFLIDCNDVTKVVEKNYKMKLKELSDFSRQIGTMLGAGVSLIRAMSILVQRDANPKIKRIYTDIYRKLQQGYTLSSAMQEQGKAFPELIVNMFKAGETSGQMEKTAMTMAKQYEKDARIKNKIRSASIYPIILLVVTALVIVIMFTFIIPSFADILTGRDLPLITEIVMGFSDALINQWYWILIGVLVLIVAIIKIISIPSVRLKLDRKKLKMPVIGKMLKIIYTARFARTMCSLYTSGISIVNGLLIVKNTIGNKYLESQFDEVVAQVKNGSNLSSSIQQIDGFDPKLASSIFVGEESGKLDNMLMTLADDFDYEAEIASQRMVSILEPVMIIILAIIVLLVMLSVLLPIFQMYQDPTGVK